MATLTPERPLLDTRSSRSDVGRRRPRYPLLAACRPHQWVKNLLVYAVAFASGHLFEPITFFAATVAAVVFTAASSATYLINDAGDVEADRRHPTKRFRPIAAGDLAVSRAHVAAVSLLVAAMVGAASLGPMTLALIVTYLVTTTTYSRWLKHIALVDAITVAAGFVLRTAAGGTATGLTITPIFLTMSAAAALFIVIGKRLGEVIELGPDAAASHRKVLAWYTPQRCRRLLGASIAATLVAFTVWALGASEPAGPSALSSGSVSLASLSIIPFTLAAARSSRLIGRGEGADPLHLLTRDRLLPLCGLVIFAIVGAAIYG